MVRTLLYKGHNQTILFATASFPFARAWKKPDSTLAAVSSTYSRTSPAIFDLDSGRPFVRKIRSDVMLFEVIEKQFERIKILALRRQELDRHATLLESISRHRAVVLAARIHSTPTSPQTVPNYSLSTFHRSHRINCNTCQSLWWSAFLSDKSQCSTPLRFAYICNVYFLT